MNPPASPAPEGTFQPIGNATRVEFLGEGRRFLGLGRVTIEGVAMRSPALPILPELRSPDAIRLGDFQVEASGPTEEGGFRLSLGASRADDGPMEWMLHAVRPRYRRGAWSQPPRRAENTALDLELRPAEIVLDGDRGVGFSYRYHYKSDAIALYKILDRATWEPGGAIEGNAFWLRNAFSPSIQRFHSPQDAYCTEWFLPSAVNPNIFEFLPFQTALCGFTFTAGEEGVLVTWVPVASHVRALFEKPRGASHLAHLYELCGDLSLAFSTAPIEVLWFPGKRNPVEQLNLYERVRALVSETLHADAGLRIERAASYGVMEEWGNADLRHYAAKGLPRLKQAGVRTIFLANHFENNMNVFGVSNMCCTADLKVAPGVGEENLAAFCREAREADASVEMWGNTALSTLALMAHARNGREERLRFPRTGPTLFDALDDAADPWVRNPSNAIEADHYTPVFAVMNLRDETVRRVWLERWRDARERLGLGGIFLDSSFNMSSDKFHWIARPASARHGATADQTQLLGHSRPEREPLPAILSQYRAHLSLMAEMQRMGYVYCGEDIGVFGVHRASGPLSNLVASLPLWVDCLPDFDPVEIARLGADPEGFFFRALAYRVVWKLQWDPQADRLTWIQGKAGEAAYAPTEGQLARLRAYNVVQPHMERRRVLRDECGVVYHGDGKTVVWTFAPARLALSEADGADAGKEVLTGRALEAGPVEAAAWSVYLFDGIRNVEVLGTP
ncbi:hypothetical protein SAMN05444156_0954 [Verrucomicrobium sp. GAS474]|uniref:hypothetical protein n=1 Tax=Verrucomicrobium sp. GAS474 TaxID=1882831 RepID=UPI00087B96C7|nr:hypothetical protein [Verrucomicrobium sp. GAS474]SDT94460.1 hypothetical protein SAMN05444156_0954 [Verrucomicrobium sp. GAS474]